MFSPRRPDATAMVLLLAMGIAVFSPAMAIRPVEGDNFYVLAWVNSARFSDLFAVDPAIYPEWRPLPYATIWLAHHLGGLDFIAGHFLVNIILWSFCAWLVYRVVFAVTGSWPAAMSGALVALVDRRSEEALTWIVERQMLMACAFGLGAMAIAMRSRYRALSGREQIAIVAMLLAAMLSKEHGAAFALALGTAGFARRDWVVTPLAGAALASYIVLRLTLASGAVAGYCEDMGLLYESSFHCYGGHVGSDLAQAAYNMAASVVNTAVSGVLSESGSINLQPWRIARSLVVGAFVIAGVRGAPVVLRPVLWLPIATALLSAVLFRPRNQLPALIAVAVFTGMGVSRLPSFPRLRQPMVRWAIVALLLSVLARRALDTRERIAWTEEDMSSADPCASDVRARTFGREFSPIIKQYYGMPDARCEGDN